MLRTILVLGLMACGNKDTDNETTEPDSSPSEPDTQDTGIEIPEPPDTFTLTLIGSDNETLVFDNSTCGIPEAFPKFDMFWRSSTNAHCFVIRVLMNGEYPEDGNYNNTDHSLSIRLQEEAGCQARFYQTDLSKGDSVTMTLEGNGEGTIWGEIQVESMHSDAGQIAISPTTLPIWCTPENTEN